MRGDEITFTIGDVEVQGRLPHMRYRFELFLAWRRALGYRPGDHDEDKRDENGLATPSGNTDGDDMTMVAMAAVGLCWTGDPLDVPAYRLVRRRMRKENDGNDDDAVHEYGECVYDALFKRGCKPQDLYNAGVYLIGEVTKSVPTTADVEEASDPSAAPGESSIGSS